MESTTRKTIEELVLTYELEPSLRDVLVEGSLDKGLITHYLRRKDHDDVMVYCIDERVVITADDLDKYGQPSGMRGGLITAAIIISKALENSASERCATFVADQDWDSLAEQRGGAETSGLLYTDFPSIEIYAWSESAIEKMLRIGFQCPQRVKAKGLMVALEPILLILFVARWVLHQADLGVPLPVRLEKYCDSKSGRVAVEKLMKAAGGGAAKNAEDLAARVMQLAADRPADVRHSIRGHDAVYLLFHELRTHVPPELRSSKAFGRVWMVSVEIAELSEYDLFKSIETRVAA